MRSEVHRPVATLRLAAERLIPATIGGILHIKPDSAAKSGETLFRRRDGTPVAASTGVWFLSTRHRDLGSQPEDHLSWVVHLVESHLSDLKSAYPDLRVDFSLLVHDADFSPSMLSQDLLSQALKIAEHLEIDVPERGMDLILTRENIADYA